MTVAYRLKVEDVMASIGRSSWSTQSDSLNVDVLLDTLTELSIDRIDQSRRINAAVSERRAALQAAARNIEVTLQNLAD